MTTNESPDAPEGDESHTGASAGRGLWALLVVVALVFAGGVGWRIGRAQGEPTVPSHASVDVGFFQDMSTHHNQAVGMAMTYLANGTVPLLRQIAGEIVTYQSSEIGVMGEYLTRWHEAGTEGSTAMGWMGMRTPRDQMTGMATRRELTELGTAHGAALDQLFTQLMIDHHVGGIHMAQYAAAHASTPEVKRWALSVEDGQRGEIAELNQWRVRTGFPAVTVTLNGRSGFVG